MASSSERLCPAMASRERHTHTAELAAAAGGKAVGDAKHTRRRSKDVGCLQPRQERRRRRGRREGAECVTSRLGSLLGSHLHSGGFFLSFPN